MLKYFRLSCFKVVRIPCRPGVIVRDLYHAWGFSPRMLGRKSGLDKHDQCTSLFSALRYALPATLIIRPATIGISIRRERTPPARVKRQRSFSKRKFNGEPPARLGCRCTEAIVKARLLAEWCQRLAARSQELRNRSYRLVILSVTAVVDELLIPPLSRWPMRLRIVCVKRGCTLPS